MAERRSPDAHFASVASSESSAARPSARAISRSLFAMLGYGTAPNLTVSEHPLSGRSFGIQGSFAIRMTGDLDSFTNFTMAEAAPLSWPATDIYKSAHDCVSRGQERGSG